MFQSNKSTRQVLFACLFTVAFFVARALAPAAFESAGSIPGLLCAASCCLLVFVSCAFTLARTLACARRCADSAGESGIVIYPNAVLFWLAAAVMVLATFTKSAFFSGLLAAGLLVCVVQACRYNRNEEVFAAVFAQLTFPFAAALLLLWAVVIGKKSAVSTLKAIGALALLSTAMPQAAHRASVLIRREKRADLRMHLALLPILFLMGVWLAAGDGGRQWLTEGLGVSREPAQSQSEQTKPSEREMHRKGAFLWGA